MATRTSSRTQFEVLGLGLEACKFSNMPCPRLEDSTIFCTGKGYGQICFVLKNARELTKKILKTFSWRTHEISVKFTKCWSKDLFFFRLLLRCVLGVGLEHSCPLPREGLSSVGLSLVLASDFFCVLSLALASSLMSSTSPLVNTAKILVHPNEK